MKHLTLIRHAKSSWGDASLRDFDRPLNERGLRDAPRIGAYLKELNWLQSKPRSRSAYRFGPKFETQRPTAQTGSRSATVLPK